MGIPVSPPTERRPVSAVSGERIAARLAAFAACAAAHVVIPRRDDDPLRHLRRVLDGSLFDEAGIDGFYEGLPRLTDPGSVPPDELSDWLARLDRDEAAACGTLYMAWRPRADRHAGGEYYTPGWLVDHVLDRAGFDGREDRSLVDPMCGAGAFLQAAVARLRRSRPARPADAIVGLVAGLDVNPLAVLMARAAYLVALGPPQPGERIRIPVACADALAGEVPAVPPADIVAGNPPWVGWESLPVAVRERTRSTWVHHGIFTRNEDRGGRQPNGMRSLLGGGRKDLCMLATFVAADRFLAPGGRLAFVVSSSIFRSASGEGFRRFRLGDGTPLRVVAVDDLSALRVFPGATSRACVLTLEKGAETRYPVAWHAWTRRSVPAVAQGAEPVDPRDPASAWLAGSAAARRRARGVIGPSAYRARAGAYTGGANGVFWIRVSEWREDGTCVAENLPAAGRRPVAQHRGRLEQALVHPLIHARDVRRFAAAPSGWILLTHDPVRRRGLARETMGAHYPRALSWVEEFRAALEARRDRGTRSLIAGGAPFWSVFSVSMETLSPWKVIWRRIASRLEAAVVGPVPLDLPGGGNRLAARPVVPQETCTFVACGSEQEACWVAGVIGSTAVNEAARAFAQPGGKSFGAPGLLSRIAVPRFDPRCAPHVDLAARVKEAGPALAQEDLDDLVAKAWPAVRVIQ